MCVFHVFKIVQMVPNCTKPLICLLNEEKMLLNEDTDNFFAQTNCNLNLYHGHQEQKQDNNLDDNSHDNTERSTQSAGIEIEISDHDLIYWI